MVDERKELELLGRAFERQPGPEEVSTAEASAALECQQLREALVAAIGPVEACRTCARGCPLPAGYYDGGRCCGHETAKLFDDDHLGMLRAVGTSATVLAAPKNPREAGCAFRTADGCALPPRLRPNPCVYYLCEDLGAELKARRRLAKVHQRRNSLEDAHQRFLKERVNRRLRADVISQIRDLLP